MAEEEEYWVKYLRIVLIVGYVVWVIIFGWGHTIETVPVTTILMPMIFLSLTYVIIRMYMAESAKGFFITTPAFLILGFVMVTFYRDDVLGALFLGDVVVLLIISFGIWGIVLLVIYFVWI